MNYLEITVLTQTLRLQPVLLWLDQVCQIVRVIYEVLRFGEGLKRCETLRRDGTRICDGTLRHDGTVRLDLLVGH